MPSQRSLQDQLFSVHALANKAGLYDAADAIFKQWLEPCMKHYHDGDSCVKLGQHSTHSTQYSPLFKGGD